MWPKFDYKNFKQYILSHEQWFQIDSLSELFCIAHKLVDLYSDHAISWYAVGCYYDLIKKSDQARRYLSKATSIDRLFGPAWLAYGHSFARENEHDQVSPPTLFDRRSFACQNRRELYSIYFYLVAIRQWQRTSKRLNWCEDVTYHSYTSVLSVD